MHTPTNRRETRAKVHRRIRAKLHGTAERPRLAVYRSTKHIYAQVIDDLAGRTLASASTREGDLKNSYGGNAGAAVQVGALLANRAKDAGIESVVFDRGGHRYHGRVKALADAAREGGLKF
jgi:large subunit ribosomal protein L18